MLVFQYERCFGGVSRHLSSLVFCRKGGNVTRAVQTKESMSRQSSTGKLSD